MNNISKISIIIPSFNRAYLIAETLNSVLAQIYVNWECIIVDDGSTDETNRVVKEYQEKDQRILFYTRNREPKGAPTCRNIGLEKATGKYVIYLDSDDLLAPFCLEQRLTQFELYPENDFLVFKNILFDKNPNEGGFYWNIETEEDDVTRFLRMDALWQTSGPIYRRDYLVDLNGFREDLLFWQDYELHLRCLLTGGKYQKIFNLPVDVFIREGMKNTISRSTPFTANLEILQKRIDFYHELVKTYRNVLNKEQTEALRSIVFFFCVQFLLKHGKFGLFYRNWKKNIRLLPIERPSFTKSLWYALILKMAVRFSFLKKIADSFYKKNTKRIPNYNILKRSKLGKIPVEV